MKFANFKNNVIFDLTKMIKEKIKTELKTFKIESPKHLSESLTWYKKQTNGLKGECEFKDMTIAKLSKTTENQTDKNLEVISQDVQTNSDPSTKKSPLWNIMSELSASSDEIQEEVAESSNTK